MDTPASMGDPCVANPITTTSSVTNVSCIGTSDGAIDITVSGGTAPYSYSWSNGSTSEDLTDVSAGTYTGVVTDANGCQFATMVTIGAPTALVITDAITVDATCNGASDGVVDIDIIGGTPPYSYSWSNGATTEDLTNVAAGTYTGVVTDNNGCQISATATVNQPAPVSGGEIMDTSTGAPVGTIEICLDTEPTTIDYLNVTGAVGSNQAWVISGNGTTILAILYI